MHNAVIKFTITAILASAFAGAIAIAGARLDVKVPAAGGQQTLQPAW